MSKKGNGEGTIYYSDKLNKWVGQFTAGRKDNGKLNRKSVYGNTRKEVKEKMTKALADIQTNTFIDKSDITIIDILTDYINTLYKSNTIKPTTYIRNQYTIEIIKKLKISTIPIQDVKISNINNNLMDLTDYSNSMIQKVCIMISQAFNQAILHGIVNNNPFTIKGAIIKPKSVNLDKKVEAFTIEEQKAFANELKKEYDIYNDIFYIALYTGMRIGEILSLHISDIDFENKVIHITKTLTRNADDKVILGKTTKTYSGTRDIPFFNILTPILKKYQGCNDFLFLHNHKFLYSSTINAHFKKICKNANIQVIIIKHKKGVDNNGNNKYVNLKSSDVNTHMLRHTFATRCIESGMSVVVLQKLLGQTDIQTTLNTYASVFNKFKQDELKKAESYFNNLSS